VWRGALCALILEGFAILSPEAVSIARGNEGRNCVFLADLENRVNATAFELVEMDKRLRKLER